MKMKLAVLLVIVLAFVGLAYWHYQSRQTTNPPTVGTLAYSSAGLTFTYPPTLYMKERVANEAKLERSVVLVENSESNRAILNGTAPVAGEGPPSITIDIYKNPQHLTPEEWMRQDTNWTQQSIARDGIVIGGLPAVSFDWSGLYEGNSSIVSFGDHIYVFSYTWLSADDVVIKEVSDVLDSVKFK